MGVIQEFFNNREIAIGIWVIIGLAVILPTKPARQFIKTAIPILFCKKFVIFYIVFLSFLGLVLFALNWAGLWDLTLLKDTVFWVLFVELPLFVRAIADKEAYEKQYQVFCKLLKASRKEVPLSEIIDCIERIVVDVDRKIMVKWTE